MILFPAIDLFGGQAVRLLHGDYNQMTVYDPNPIQTIAKFEQAGASHVHLVDLEGARTGKTTNLETIKSLCKQSDCFIQVGGGIRDVHTIERYLAAGASRVIIGTAAVRDPAFVVSAVEFFGESIAVGVDLKDGKVAVQGWTEVSDYGCDDFCLRMQDAGVSTLICTDISRDGAMQGSNRTLYRYLQQRFPSMNIIASGGVNSVEDLIALRDTPLYGAIIGKAYYTGAIDLAAALSLEGME